MTSKAGAPQSGGRCTLPAATCWRGDTESKVNSGIRCNFYLLGASTCQLQLGMCRV